MDKAKEKAAEKLGVYWRGKDKCSIQSAELLEVSNSLDLKEFLDQEKVERKTQKRAKQEADQKAKDEADYERLRAKLGK